METAKDILNSVTGNIPRAIITFQDKEGNGSIVERMIEVQYNPVSLSFSTVADDAELQSLQTSGQTMGIIYQTTSPTNTVMNLDLIFDDVNNFDAFMNEKFILSSGMAASAVSKVIHKDYSVRAKINAFIGMITGSQTRILTFSWSKFSFRGELTGVNSELTMFNVLGNPIRGKVSLSIRQKEDSSKLNESLYNQAFDTLFGGNAFTSSSADAKSMGDKMGNLLNLNVL